MWRFPDELAVSPNLRLVALRAQHASDLLTAADTPDLFKHSARSVTNQVEAAAFIAAASHDDSRFAYLILDDNSPIGTTSFYHVDAKRRVLAIGYTWLSRRSHGTGVNGQIKATMLDYAWALGAVRIEFTIDEDNTRSRKAVEKLGARLEGIMINHRLRLDGSHGHTALYALTRQPD